MRPPKARLAALKLKKVSLHSQMTVQGLQDPFIAQGGLPLLALFLELTLHALQVPLVNSQVKVP